MPAGFRRHLVGKTLRHCLLLCCYCLHLDNPHIDFGKRLVKFKGSRLWNNLPDSVKTLISLPAFKNSLKNYLLIA